MAQFIEENSTLRPLTFNRFYHSTILVFFCLYVLSVCLSACLSFSLSVCLWVCMSICLAVRQYVRLFVYLYVRLYVHLSDSICLPPSVFVLLCLSVSLPFIFSFTVSLALYLSNGHSPQIRENGKLLVRMWRGESLFLKNGVWPMSASLASTR